MSKDRKKTIVKRKMTEERKAAFIEHLTEHGLVRMAARHASPHTKSGAHTVFYDERERDPEFAKAWDDAIEINEEQLINELKRRGIEGYEEDVWGSGGPGAGTVKVGTRTVYSDKLAELYARVHSARVRQGLRQRVELDATVESKPAIDMSKLTAEERTNLEKILASAAARAAEESE